MTQDAGPHGVPPSGGIGYDAILLAGGRASRLGGIDKTALLSDGTALFDRALASASGAGHTVVVGLRAGHRAPADTLLVREDPPLSGPAAAIGAGLSALGAGLSALGASSAFTLVLACDLVRPEEAVRRLLATGAAGARDGLVAVDPTGRRQPLLAVYRTSALGAAVAAAGDLENLSLRRLLAPLDLREVELPAPLCADVDSPEDAQRLLGGGGADH